MKKIAMMMLALAATLSFTSCDSAGPGDYATDVAYGTVVSTMPVTLMTDANQQLVVADDSGLPTANRPYSPTYGQRALIYYTPLLTADGQKSSQVKLHGYIHFDRAETAVIAAGEEVDYGQLSVDIYNEGGNYYLVHVTKKVIDMAMMFTANESKMSEHEFTLVLDEDEPVTNGYLNLTLAHGASEAESSATAIGASFFTFDMSDFAAHIEGTTGVVITAKGINKSEPVKHRFMWAN
ncbi:MAG: hypothetical protein IKY68_05610 [Alistipes sp.]|nr:hypothetical protein [Alistipes sp.]